MLIRLQKLYLHFYANFRKANDVAQWNSKMFNFELEGGCKCLDIDPRMQEIEPGLLNQPSFYDSHLLQELKNRGKFS